MVSLLLGYIIVMTPLGDSCSSWIVVRSLLTCTQHSRPSQAGRHRQVKAGSRNAVNQVTLRLNMLRVVTLLPCGVLACRTVL